ncbi:hypothetical protein TREMEDRAFT_56712, partial [Tremella mesenterica DSM 1558]|uniref:uncharacterized protein n=1 Tax=Tremella mesenterica (strain ATCC 24925 / CBS 8224 / DSM 1558 / NBRC 9311 / NRRL Y-6157 / RJB 2259-6 / UBC 559-6) TaxID=578456 RepID=UPI0003F49FC7
MTMEEIGEGEGNHGMSVKGNTMKVAVIGSGLAGLTTAYLLRQEGYRVYLIEKSNRLGFHSSSVNIPFNNCRFTSGPNTKDETIRAEVGEEYQNDNKVQVEENDEERESEKWIVDVPMRSFQGGYYPHLLALYRHLNLPLIPIDYTFSFSHFFPSSSVPIRDTEKSYDPQNPSSTRLNDPDYTQETHFIHSGNSGISLPSLPSNSYSSLSSFFQNITRWFKNAMCFIILLFLSTLSANHFLPTTLRKTTLRQFTL